MPNIHILLLERGRPTRRSSLKMNKVAPNLGNFTFLYKKENVYLQTTTYIYLLFIVSGFYIIDLSNIRLPLPNVQSALLKRKSTVNSVFLFVEACIIISSRLSHSMQCRVDIGKVRQRKGVGWDYCKRCKNVSMGQWAILYKKLDAIDIIKRQISELNYEL